MLSNYKLELKNELSSNTKTYEDDSKFLAVLKLKGDGLEVDRQKIYERLFTVDRGGVESAAQTIIKLKGSKYLTQETYKTLEDILDGKVDSIQSRSDEALKIIKILLELILNIQRLDTLEVLTSSRNTEDEIKQFSNLLLKMTGGYTNSDLDSFEVIKKIHRKFKNHKNNLFSSLSNEYNTATDNETVLDLNKIKKSKIEKLLTLFNNNKPKIIEVLDEVASSGVVQGIDVIVDELNSRISSSSLNEISKLIVFYLRHLKALYMLSNYDLVELAEKYSAVNSDTHSKLIEEAKLKLNADIKFSKSGVLALESDAYIGDVLDFLKNEDACSNSLYLTVSKNEYESINMKAVSFLMHSFKEGIDFAIDNINEVIALDIYDDEDSILIKLGNHQDQKESIMSKYYAIMAVKHGFSLNKLAFMQKYI